MPSPTAHDVQKALLALKLVEVHQLDECLNEMGTMNGSSSALLSALQQRNLLTPYQVAKLKKGENDALVVSGYKLMYRNASGSFARVFRACSLDDGRTIGLKVLRQRWARDPGTVALFHREGEFGKRLKHRNIVPVYDVGNDGDQHFISMEFVEGGNLRELLKIREKFSPLEATRYALDMSEGLNYALKQGVTHRDLKLTNVLLSSQGVAKLVDFGLAGDEATISRLDESGAAVQRAIEYATLEKGTQAPDNDPRSDLYFLGGIYYELLTGNPPYPPTRVREERKHLSRYRDIRPIRSADPSIPHFVCDIVDELMAFNPNDRFQSPQAVIPVLRSAMQELDPSYKPSASSEEPKSHLPTILCIESRHKQQDILRGYLTRKGFRVLMVSNLERGLNRLANDPPDTVLLMADPLGESFLDAYRRAVRAARRVGTIVVAMLPKKMADLVTDLPQDELAHVLVQPATLRDIRNTITAAVERRDAKSGRD